ncbi:MAG TPA: chemotaxis protein CheW [Usitatibacter sp.]|nr:chemotaxis protein CheW [Usitatibacter sp.]
MNAMTITREATREVLVVVLGSEEYGVDILEVQEIRGYENVTPIPAAPAYVKGVVNLRGRTLPVVDLRVKFGMADPRYDAFTVVVILRLARRVIGLVVDGVSDVMALDAGEVQPAPPSGSVVESAFLEGLGSEGERKVLLLDVEKLLSAEELDLLDRVTGTVPGN